MFAEINGARIGYSDTGGDGPVFLLVHGFPLNRSMWDPQVPALSEIGRVIVPDLRGFGASELGERGLLTAERHADDLAALLDELDVEQVIYVGLSMGGYVAFGMWEKHPERIKAFVIADARPVGDNEVGRQARLAMAASVEADRSSEAVAVSMLPRLFHAVDEDHAHYVNTRDVILRNKPETVADAARALAARGDARPLISTISVPTLVIVGENDAMTPLHQSEEIAELIEGARLVVIPEVGHMSNMEAPAAFNRAITDFVEELA
jgi:pimeloyl-ACP methyl ester carboxylesterase